MTHIESCWCGGDVVGYPVYLRDYKVRCCRCGRCCIAASEEAAILLWNEDAVRGKAFAAENPEAASALKRLFVLVKL